MNLIEKARKLCTPAYIYLVISLLTMFAMIIQNFMYGSRHNFCIGEYCINVKDESAGYIEIMGAPALTFFVVQVFSILLWTYILNTICKFGYKNVSWFLVLLPFISIAFGFTLSLLAFGKRSYM